MCFYFISDFQEMFINNIPEGDKPSKFKSYKFLSEKFNNLIEFCNFWEVKGDSSFFGIHYKKAAKC